MVAKEGIFNSYPRVFRFLVDIGEWKLSHKMKKVPSEDRFRFTMECITSENEEVDVVGIDQRNKALRKYIEMRMKFLSK
jgi:hypothetical protein